MIVHPLKRIYRSKIHLRLVLRDGQVQRGVAGAVFKVDDIVDVKLAVADRVDELQLAHHDRKM